ncbi:hypothetical protein PENTCL1PPCAC_2215 [Pristionchus entomophagus]|uniref:Ground-like domain-containing protein n=1 Tax=Pristionchus entomophagus TaxID=358040 RepID=A0AAV5SIQ4_9BILA|nr:hypothetical protein PENTCL1PPCAC_2215 [Pristionchus entomophagus]
MHRFLIVFFIVSGELKEIRAAEECFKPVGSDSCSKGKPRSLKDVEVLWVEETSTEGFPVLRNIKTRQAVPMPMGGGNGTDPSVIAALLGAPHTAAVPNQSTNKDAMIVISEQGDVAPGSFQVQEGINGRRPAGPLPRCFFNRSGFSCCNHVLNDLVEGLMERMQREPAYSRCNTHRITQRISATLRGQPGWERQDFEIMVSLGDFAQTVHFQGDLACKLEIDGKFFLVYGTPKFDSAGVFMTRMRM